MIRICFVNTSSLFRFLALFCCHCSCIPCILWPLRRGGVVISSRSCRRASKRLSVIMCQKASTDISHYTMRLIKVEGILRVSAEKANKLRRLGSFWYPNFALMRDIYKDTDTGINVVQCCSLMKVKVLMQGFVYSSTTQRSANSPI